LRTSQLTEESKGEFRRVHSAERMLQGRVADLKKSILKV
jgi:hypothetical protein